MTDVAFACTCGALTGRMTGIGRGTGIHLGCHCNACRAAELALGQPDPRPGPVHLYQCTPDRVAFDTGAEHLALLKLHPKTKTFRWYAACCDAPLFTSGPGPAFPFANLNVARAVDPTPLGPMRAEAFIQRPGGKTTSKHIGRFVYSVITTGLSARLSGRWKQTPFFDVASGEPKAPVRVLTAEERVALPLKG